MKVLVLVACLVAAALADEVPREIKEKKTVVEALPGAFEAPVHFDESKGPFHFGELRSLKPLVAEKAFGSQQFGGSRVDVKEYQVVQPVVTAYSAAPLGGQYEKVVKTVETVPGAAVYTSPAEYHVYEHQQPGAVFVKSVQEQVPVSAFQQTYVASQPAASAIYKTEKVEEKPLLLTGDIQKIEKIEKVEKIEGDKVEAEKIDNEKIEKVEKVEKVELPAATTYSGGYEHSAFIQKQPALATLNGYRSVFAQPAVAYQQTTLTQQPTFEFGKKIVTHEAVPVISTYTSSLPAASAYKKESTVYSAVPAVATYTSSFPAASAYKKESTVYSAAPAISTYTTSLPAESAYKKESTIYSAAPAVATYTSSFPSASAYKKESTVYSAAPAVTTYTSSFPAASSAYKKESTVYSAAPAVSSYKQVISSAAPAVSSYKQESVLGQSSYAAQPAVSSYSATVQPAVSYKKEIVSAPATFEKASNIYSQSAYGLKSVVNNPVVTSYKKEVVSTPSVSTYSSLPASSTYQKESSVFGQASYVAQPAVSTYKQVVSSTPVVSGYKQESTIVKSSPGVSTYGASYLAGASGSAFQKDSLEYSQSAQKYGGASYQSAADGSSAILKLYREGDGTGIYQYGYATSNGINFDEEGKVYALNAKSSEGKIDGASAVTGSYSYVGPDGVTYTVKYIADENGFRAFGDHLPKLSEEAQRALDEAAKEGDKYDEEGNLKQHY